MHFSHVHHSLPRRLASLHLMGGLACLLLSLGLSLALAARGMLLDFASAVAIVPVALLLIGVVLIRRTTNVHASIEEQLRRFAFVPTATEDVLHPLPETDPLGVGWNSLLERVSNRTALERIEDWLEMQQTPQDSRWSQVLDHLPDGIAVTGGDGVIVLANRSLHTLLGLTAEPTVNVNPIEALTALAPGESASIHSRFRSPHRPVVFELHQGQTLAEGVLRIARFPVRGSRMDSPAMSGNQSASPREESPGHVWSVRDVTQQKLAEELRNQFVSTATHELRTPLANIKAYAETLAAHEDIDPEQQKQFFNTINAEATRLSRFVDELLNVSQMESGALSLSRHETDLLRLTEEVVAHVQPEYEKKQIRFEQNLPVKLPKLHVDKDKVSAALVNLLGNAAKYTPEGGQVRLIVETKTSELQFHIEDTGYGIAPEEIPKLFDKFFRSDDERVRQVTGSGLGLTFTQEVARLHGGRVTVHSELDKGSRFTLSLPLNPDRDLA
jgi:PAS domain S-box-containing protein